MQYAKPVTLNVEECDRLSFLPYLFGNDFLYAQSLPEQLSLRREHAVNEVYVIAGGEWLRNNLNAIAAFMGTWTWDSIEKIALTLSVLAVAVMWVQRHNVMDLLGWVAVFVLISLLVNVRTSVQIIDNSDLVKVHRVPAVR